MSIERISPGPLMSQAVIHGDTIYLSGLVAGDLDADVKGQTAQVLARIDEVLAAAGSDKSKLIRAQIWLTDIATWSDMNEVWSDWLEPGTAPARATVEAPLANPKISVEIMVEAAR